MESYEEAIDLVMEMMSLPRKSLNDLETELLSGLEKDSTNYEKYQQLFSSIEDVKNDLCQLAMS
ncbi:MAG: hypothetical protein J6Z02_07095 [Lachnospiraceae bacterium]|nr:hypothetical protein [Lachnospiraceae bacterium]